MSNVALYRKGLADKRHLKHVYYTGSDALLDGYAVCYDRDDAQDTDISGTTIAITSSSPGRFLKVEKPASGNLHNFAGIVVGDHAAVSGGHEIDIIEPSGHVYDVYSDVAALTANQNFVTIQPGTYAFGKEGEGLIVGEYIQTKTAAGLTQAIIRGVDQRDVMYGVTVPSSSVRTPSSIIWETCPLALIQSGRLNGVHLFDDFTAGHALAANQAATALGDMISGFTAATAGTTITSETDEPNGSLRLSSTTTTEEAAIALGGKNLAGMFTFSATSRLWFEARVKIGPDAAGVDDCAAFIGLAQEGLLSAAALVAATGAMADVDYVGFLSILADENFDAVWNTASGGASPVTLSADAHDPTADAYVNLGLMSNGTSLQAYVNGVASGDADLLAATDFPLGEEMNVYFVLMNVGGADATANIDWVRCVQLGR